MIAIDSRQSAHLPLAMARCEPSRPCPQRASCARANDPLEGAQVIDASKAVRVSASACSAAWCSLFVDVRGIALLEAA